jgi:hypothetical protein
VEVSQHFPAGIFVPPKATSINGWVRSIRGSMSINCQVSECEFLTWAEAKQWKVTRIQPKDAPVVIENVYTIKDGANGTVELKDGYYMRRREGNYLIVVVYDNIHAIAYITSV